MVLIVLTSSPTPWHGPRQPMPWNKSRPYRVPMAQVPLLSDEWLSIYRLLENFNTRMAIFKGVLDFNLDPIARCHGMKAKPTGHLWSKYERFLISGCQDMDF